jgi:cytochrome c553
MKKIALTLLVTSAALMAANPAACKGCHGANGEKKALGKSAIINQMSKADFIAALKGFKDGSRPATAMKGQVRNMTEADMEVYADTFAAK